MKKLNAWIGLTLILSSCAITRELKDPVQADYSNPCTDSRNCLECSAWSKAYPKEYARYERRMNGRGLTSYCHFPTIELESGFYWVRILDTWTIAEYVKEWNLFCITGDGNTFYPSEFEEINPKPVVR